MICPYCGATDHKRYEYKGMEMQACPVCPPHQILFYEGRNVSFKTWECVECGERGIGSLEELYFHLEEHKPNDFEEWSNYQGE